MGFDQVLTRCVEKWRGEGIALAAPVNEAEVRSVWDRLGVWASDDVVRLYSTVGGFEDYESDDDFFWSLWPWEMIREEYQSRRAEGIMFCDHSIQVLTWELRFEDKHHSSVWQIDDGLMTAPSLESFLQLYSEAPWRLLDPWDPQPGSAPTKPRRMARTGRVAGKSDPLWDETSDG